MTRPAPKPLKPPARLRIPGTVDAKVWGSSQGPYLEVDTPSLMSLEEAVRFQAWIDEAVAWMRYEAVRQINAQRPALSRERRRG